MFKIHALCGLAAAIWLGAALPARPECGTNFPAIEIGPQDRIMVLAPHPDDEAIACGGIIQKAVAAGAAVKVVFLTYGDNNQWSFAVYRKHPVLTPSAMLRMGEVRHNEAVEADRLLGLSASNLVFLGYPDHGTIHLWTSRWGAAAPFQSMMTRVSSVPYIDALRPGAPYKGEELLRDLTTVLREFRPTQVFVSHPADYNPDHRTLYLFTRVALWDLEDQMRPAIHPFLVHFKRWPRSSRGHPDLSIEPPTPIAKQVQWTDSMVGRRENVVKEAAIRAHVSQFEYSSSYLLSFVRCNELFGDFPSVNLPPDHAPTDLSAGDSSAAAEPPEQLTDEESASYVGVEWKRATIEDGRVVLSTELSRPLAPTVQASLYLFGYRPGIPFAGMPKLRIEVGPTGHTVSDRGQPLARNSVKLTRHLREIEVSVPLASLGNPLRILVSARTYVGDLPLDWVSWRVLKISAGEKEQSDARP